MNTKLVSRSFFIFLILSGCWKPDDIKLAEEASEQGDSAKAAELYAAQIAKTDELDEDGIGLLSLNAGLAFLEAGKIDQAEKHLQTALEKSTNIPEIQSKALNALGNIYYLKTNGYLDKQDVNQARSSWEKARELYSAAYSIDGNTLAEENLTSLNDQIQERIESMVCRIQGIVWRDINGNGRTDKDEPSLKSTVFWDRDSNGDHNKSEEPYISTDTQGRFAFEWISGTFPTSLRIASFLSDQNQSQQDILLPLFPPPPPPMDATNIKNHLILLDQPGDHQVMIPWRAAPMLKGKVWNDTNANSEIDPNETGSAAATIFIDTNGNLSFDENETSFKPAEDGTFSQVVPPGQFSVCVLPDNQEANITRPIEEHKAYLTWVDFEQSSHPLLFGLQQDGNSSNSSDPQKGQDSQPAESQSDNSDKKEDQTTEDVNALYERLLQETESKSEPLQVEQVFAPIQNTGRDY